MVSWCTNVGAGDWLVISDEVLASSKLLALACGTNRIPVQTGPRVMELPVLRLRTHSDGESYPIRGYCSKQLCKGPTAVGRVVSCKRVKKNTLDGLPLGRQAVISSKTAVYLLLKPVIMTRTDHSPHAYFGLRCSGFDHASRGWGVRIEFISAAVSWANANM